MFRIKQPTIEQIIIVLFSILPIVDSVNGILITNGLPSIGTVYKLFTLGLLFVFSLRKGGIYKSVILPLLLATMYIIFSIFANMYFLSGELINANYPIKLFFNILTVAMLINCIHAGYINGNSLYKILNISTWLMIFVILVPYVLGLGYTIYYGDIGYKGFFYSNNELSAALIILFYFSLYRLSRKIGIPQILQLLCIMVCVLLLNTKSGMAACLLGGVLFVLEYLLRRDTKYKGLVILAILLGLYVTKDFIISQVQGFMTRQTYLHDLYGGSILDTILSGRTFHIENAWEEMQAGSALLLRLLIGNGFCSETLVEMDFIDIFFYLGTFGVIGLTAFLVWVFVKSIPNFKKDHTLVRPVGFLTTIGFAFLAGHVFFMATAGCYFVLMCCFCLAYHPDRTENIDMTR
ncbi:MAG: O-antigen ligase family protein [Oscillospiraceae bacterium]|nr:O-antigen ligase family protein [Oscillospiraceae bacterium]